MSDRTKTKRSITIIAKITTTITDVLDNTTTGTQQQTIFFCLRVQFFLPARSIPFFSRYEELGVPYLVALDRHPLPWNLNPCAGVCDVALGRRDYDLALVHVLEGDVVPASAQ